MTPNEMVSPTSCIVGISDANANVKDMVLYVAKIATANTLEPYMLIDPEISTCIALRSKAFSSLERRRHITENEMDANVVLVRLFGHLITAVVVDCDPSGLAKICFCANATYAVSTWKGALQAMKCYLG